MNLAGCDISHYQGSLDFDRLARAVGFVIIKATEGTGYRDPSFIRSWSEAGRVGTVRGAYHFARPDEGSTPEDEADFFLATVGPLAPGDLLALDYEVNYRDPVTWCAAFLDYVRGRTGVPPFIYLNQSTVRAYDWAPVYGAGYPLWLADYDFTEAGIVTPWPRGEDIKQNSDVDHIDGIAGDVDGDVFFYGDADALRAYGFTGGDMDRAAVTAIIKAYLADVYGPALEAEIVERVAAAVAGAQPNLDGLAAAVETRIAAKLAAP